MNIYDEVLTEAKKFYFTTFVSLRFRGFQREDFLRGYRYRGLFAETQILSYCSLKNIRPLCLCLQMLKCISLLKNFKFI